MSNAPKVEQWELISVYTRAQAIEDGELIDVSKTAREAGITFPVALTRNVWNRTIEWTGDAHQDEAGRLWDVVWMLRDAIKRAKHGADRLKYTVRVIDQKTNRPRIHELTSVCGPGDEGEPVITIMFPDDD